MTPSDFGDPRATIDPRSLRVSPTGLAVIMETPSHGLIAVLPVAGQSVAKYIALRAEAEVRRVRRAHAALALSALFIVAVSLAATVFGPGTAAHPFALASIGILLVSTAAMWQAHLRVKIPEHGAVIPRDLIDTLTQRDVARIRVGEREGRADDVVEELVRRRVFGSAVGDTTSSLPVIAAA